MNTTSRLATGLLLGLALAMPATAAPPEGKGKPDKHHQHEKRAAKDKHGGQRQSAPDIVVQISAADARRIALDHHTVGYSALPPGIRKNLARGKPLPPGIAKRGVPSPVLAQLPRYPGYEWQVAGSDLVLIAVATAVVTEVLTGVFD